MRYLSVCSGIEAATVAWHPLGWEPAAFSDIEKFPRAVLRHHYPDVPLHGRDQRKGEDFDDYAAECGFQTIKENEYGPIDLLVGGTPCQSFSIAGLRGGLDDDRGNLALEFVRLAARERPRWVVWENVPGVLSSNGGRDFGSILGALGHIGYGFAYRVLDAQFFGVPQRRRRVFVVGHLGDWRRAAAVLFERESLSGNPAPSREARKVAPTLPARSTAGGGLGTDFDLDGGQTPVWPASVPPTLNAAFGEKQGLEDQHALNGAGCFVPGLQTFDRQSSGEYGEEPVASTVSARDYKSPSDLVAFNSREDPCATGPVSRSLGSSSPQAQAVAFKPSHFTRGKDGAPSEVDTPLTADADKGDQDPVVAFAENTRAEIRTSEVDNLTAGGGKPGQGYPAMFSGSAVRRLTPRECERLQGFPDDYTAIPWRGKPAEECPDGPQYRALGNSMPVPVMRWIGERIQMVDEIPPE